MLFTVVPRDRYRTVRPKPGTCALVRDKWNDWFKFETTFDLIVVAEDGQRIDAGSLKIGQYGLTKRRPQVPEEFDTLSEDFFSVGQGEDYYEKFLKLNPELRRLILSGLKDCAADLSIFERAFHEEVMQEFLLRSVASQSVRGRFNRVTQGNSRLTRYSFSFQLKGESINSPVLNFEVIPETTPPTNIHVLIGRNGVGKTTSLGRLTQALMAPDEASAEIAKFRGVNEADEWQFASLVSVAFSAFDPFVPLVDGAKGRRGIRFGYVGLKRPSENVPQNSPPKSLKELTSEFVESVGTCRVGIKAERWKKALETLEADPLFQEAEVSALLETKEREWRRDAASLFNRLSAGHKTVLLTTTRLVELVDEASLVLLDEPEAHLHPPLLSAFCPGLIRSPGSTEWGRYRGDPLSSRTPRSSQIMRLAPAESGRVLKRRAAEHRNFWRERGSFDARGVRPRGDPFRFPPFA